MILYYKNPEYEGEESNIYIDFHSILDRVKHRIPETTLYRMLQRHCHSYRYRNRDLYPFKDVLEIPQIGKDLKINKNERDQ
jgi:hypothetical protein